MIADIEELEEMDASELHARRLIVKEVLTPVKGGILIFPVADGTVKTPGGDRRLKPSTIIRDRPERGEEQEVFWRTIRRTLFSKPSGMMQTLKMTSGLLREISFIAITWNPESNCTCREKNHSQFH